MPVYDHENDPRIFGGDNDPRLNDPPARCPEAGVHNGGNTTLGDAWEGWIHEWCDRGMVDLVNYLRPHDRFRAYLEDTGRV